jgi:uncharacterized protein YjiS (DUF1127 family)
MSVNSDIRAVVIPVNTPAHVVDWAAAYLRAVDWMISRLRAFLRWRAQRRAIAHLHTLSDHVLRDIGIHRSDIEAAVRGYQPEWVNPRGLLH